MSIITELPEVEGIYRENVLMSRMTWFNVGGIADILFKPKNVNDLSNFLQNKKNDLPINIIGVCSNTIIRDNRIKGVTIKLGKEFTDIKCCGNTIIAGAGALLSNLSIFAQKNNIGGFEFYIGIPGTVGGAICMNAGSYGNDTSALLLNVKAMDNKGNIRIIKKEEMGYVYRGNSLKEQLIFLEATFIGYKSNYDKISLIMKDIVNQRILSQPIKGKTGGSTF